MRRGSSQADTSTQGLNLFLISTPFLRMNKIEVKTREEFLGLIKKASIIILYADTSLPIFNQFVCSLGELNMSIISYDKYEVIEIKPHVALLFGLFWTKEPKIKYYFIQKVDENDKFGAVIPAKSNEIIEKWLEDTVK